MTAKEQSQLDKLNIVPSCKITRLEIDYTTDKANLIIIDEIPYTPKSITNSFKENKILDEASWVIGPVGKELWILNSNNEIAKQL